MNNKTPNELTCGCHQYAIHNLDLDYHKYDDEDETGDVQQHHVDQSLEEMLSKQTCCHNFTYLCQGDQFLFQLFSDPNHAQRCLCIEQG